MYQGRRRQLHLNVWIQGCGNQSLQRYNAYVRYAGVVIMDLQSYVHLITPAADGFSCNRPSRLPEGAYYAADTFVYSTVIDVMCYIGYKLVGGLTSYPVTCHMDGQWHPNPADIQCVGKSTVIT